MMVGDPLTTNTLEQQEQRAQCLRFCMTMFLLFSTFFLIRVQQDTYGNNHDRRRRKHTDPLLAPEAASLDVVYVHRYVSRGLWVRGATGTGPILTSAFIAFLPGDSVPSVPPPTSVTTTPSGGNSSSTGVPAGYFDSYEPLAGLRQATPPHGSWAVESNSPWGPKMHTTALAEVGSPGFPSLLAVYRDTRLFKHGTFPGCDSSGGINHCLLSFVKLPLSACLTTPATLGTGLPISWTCANVLSSITTDHPLDVSAGDQRPSEYENDPGCIRLVTGSSLSAITGYAADALRRPYLKSTANAGALLQFCGAPLAQLISVDAVAGRVFFVQRSTRAAVTRRLSEGARTGATQGQGDELGSQKQNTLSQADVAHLASDSDSGKNGDKWRQPYGYSPQDSEDTTGRRTEQVSTRRLQEGKKGDGLASVCVSYAYLDGFYDDVSRCLPVPTESEGSDALGDPVYMHIDPLTDALMFGAFDPEGQLVLSFHHSLTLKRKFAVRFEGFESGRLMSAEFSSLGKILVAGNEEPYKHRLDVIDVASGYHEHIDISPV